jgi:hypothetical protein
MYLHRPLRRGGAPARARDRAVAATTRRCSTISVTPIGGSAARRRHASSGAARCATTRTTTFGRSSSARSSAVSTRSRAATDRWRWQRRRSIGRQPAKQPRRCAVAAHGQDQSLPPRRRPACDGYHLLDSLVAFAEAGDVLAADPAGGP